MAPRRTPTAGVTIGRVLLAGAFGTTISMGFAACGDEGPAPTTSQRVAAFLRDCGLLSLGRYEGHAELHDDGCALDCYTSQSCIDAKQDLCSGQPAASFSACLAGCGPRCSDGVTPMTRCNGVAECGDASDEIGCASFTCTDGTMVLQALTCNGTPNCPDGSDETSCSAADAMPCANGAMVSGRRCDSVPQCPDGSDEAVGCASPICTTAIATPSASAPPSASASSTVPVPPPSGS